MLSVQALCQQQPSRSILSTQPKKVCACITGSLEGPEHGVYIRGRNKGTVIELPEYWLGLVDEDTITVQLTAIGEPQNLCVADIKDNKVYVKGVEYFYFVQAERKDIEKFGGVEYAV